MKIYQAYCSNILLPYRIVIGSDEKICREHLRALLPACKAVNLIEINAARAIESIQHLDPLINASGYDRGDLMEKHPELKSVLDAYDEYLDGIS